MEEDEEEIPVTKERSENSLGPELSEESVLSTSVKSVNIEDSPETDLELEEEKSDFDVTGRSLYLSVCRNLGIVPTSYFLRHIQDSVVNLRHYGLGRKGARALSYPLQKNTTILTLDLQDNWIEAEGGEYIANMLKENCYIVEVDLSENHLGHRGGIAVCKMLTVNTTLQSINLAGNQFTDQEAPFFAEAIYENNRVKCLDISHNEFADESGSILGHAIGENGTLEEINLSWNFFRRKSLLDLCDGIANNCRLRDVDLSMNGIDSETAFGVAEIIKRSRTIRNLDVSNNRIGLAGAVIIGKALEVSDVLKTFKISYNTIGVEGAKAILKGIDNDVSVITTLEMEGIEVDKEFRDMERNLNREVKVIRGPVLSDYETKIKPRPDKYLFSKPLSEVTPENIIPAIKQYCENNEINLLEAISSLDKRKDFCLSVSDFQLALEMAGIELTEKQTLNLMNILDDLVFDDVINFELLKSK